MNFPWTWESEITGQVASDDVDGKRKIKNLRSCQSGDILEEERIKEERKQEGAGNRIDLLSSHVWTFEEGRQIEEGILMLQEGRNLSDCVPSWAWN